MKIIRHIALLVACLSAAVSVAWADGKSEAMLDALAGRIRALGAYKVQFTASAESTEVSGEYIVSGNRFYMKVPGVEIVSDGAERYEVNHEFREIAIDKAAPGSSNILTNPVGAFEFANANFASEYAGTANVGGKECDIVKLTPKQKGTNITLLVLAIEKASGLPRSLEYSADGIAGSVVVSVTSFGSYTGEGGIFSFDPQRYEGYEITDFR